MKQFFQQYSKRLFAMALAAAVLIGGGAVWNAWENVKKENNLVLLQSGQDTELFLLGTIHGSHYKKSYRYSLAEIQSVIDAVSPELLLVETRQETFENYGVLDGPSEMVFAWCYAQEKGIPVQGIDWWEVSPDIKANSDNAGYDKIRDDRIFENLQCAARGKKKVLVLCGMAHRKEQAKRLIDAGYRKQEIKQIDSYFGRVDETHFSYPKTLIEMTEKGISYFKKDFVEEILANTEQGSKQQRYWLETNQDAINSMQEFINTLYLPNKLYL